MDYSDEIAIITAQLRLNGWSLRSPRVRQWLRSARRMWELNYPEQVRWWSKRPWHKLSQVPNELIIPLAKVLAKQNPPHDLHPPTRRPWP